VIKDERDRRRGEPGTGSRRILPREATPVLTVQKCLVLEGKVQRA
jgi:hypothetical protein